MGAWGSGVFENDEACDFAANVAEGEDLRALDDALDRVLAAEGKYLEAPDAVEGLAAADIVARLKGSPGVRSSYTATIDAWVARLKLAPSEELIDKSRRCIARILSEPSELMELWQESKDFEAWKRAVEDVSRRL
jgi:hypothetical protein